MREFCFELPQSHNKTPLQCLRADNRELITRLAGAVGLIRRAGFLTSCD